MKLNREKIKKTLTLKGWNQTDLAKKAGVSRQWIDRLMDEDKDIRLSTVQIIANALEFDAKDLLIEG